MTADVTRDEYNNDMADLKSRIDRVEGKIDVLSAQQSAIAINTRVAVANEKAAFWRVIAGTTIGIITGIMPYVLHLTGVLK